MSILNHKCAIVVSLIAALILVAVSSWNWSAVANTTVPNPNVMPPTPVPTDHPTEPISVGPVSELPPQTREDALAELRANDFVMGFAIYYYMDEFKVDQETALQHMATSNMGMAPVAQLRKELGQHFTAVKIDQYAGKWVIMVTQGASRELIDAKFAEYYLEDYYEVIRVPYNHIQLKIAQKALIEELVKRFGDSVVLMSGIGFGEVNADLLNSLGSTQRRQVELAVAQAKLAAGGDPKVNIYYRDPDYFNITPNSEEEDSTPSPLPSAPVPVSIPPVHRSLTPDIPSPPFHVPPISRTTSTTGTAIFASHKVRVKGHRARVQISCPAKVTACKGQLVIRTVKNRGSNKRRLRTNHRVTLGRAKFRLRGGQHRRINVHVKVDLTHLPKRLEGEIASAGVAASAQKMTMRLKTVTAKRH